MQKMKRCLTVLFGVTSIVVVSVLCMLKIARILGRMDVEKKK